VVSLICGGPIGQCEMLLPNRLERLRFSGNVNQELKESFRHG